MGFKRLYLSEEKARYTAVSLLRIVRGGVLVCRGEIGVLLRGFRHWEEHLLLYGAAKDSHVLFLTLFLFLDVGLVALTQPNLSL
jgi:hypothetical protein